MADVHDGGLDQDPFPLMMVPTAQVTDGMTALNSGIQPMIWLVRTHGDPHQYIAAITKQLRLVSGGFPVAHVRPMTEVVVESTARQDFNMLLLTIFGATALILAAIGIYGLMAYSVQQRTQEMGIRMALGADRAHIRGLVVWQGMRLAIVGVVLGIGAAFGSHPLAGQLSLWRQSVGPAGVCHRAFDPDRGCAVCGLVSRHARLAPRPPTGAAHRVMHFLGRDLPRNKVHHPAQHNCRPHKQDEAVEAVAQHLFRRIAHGDAEDRRREDCHQHQ